MARAQMDIDHEAQAAYIDLGVESRGVGGAVEISPTVNVDLDRTGAAVGVELLSLSPDAMAWDALRRNGCLRDEDARLLEQNLPVILEFLARRSAAADERPVDVFYLSS